MLSAFVSPWQMGVCGAGKLGNAAQKCTLGRPHDLGYTETAGSLITGLSYLIIDAFGGIVFLMES